MYQKVQQRRFFFVKKAVFLFLENLRNQGENLEKFKKRPCKAKKPEYSEKMGNLRNKPSTGKTPPFLIFRY